MIPTRVTQLLKRTLKLSDFGDSNGARGGRRGEFSSRATRLHGKEARHNFCRTWDLA